MRPSGHCTIDTAERYLCGELDERASAAFEEHYFECERCFDVLRGLEALRTELAQTRNVIEVKTRVPGWARASRWLPLAALVVLGVAGAFWFLERRPEPAREEMPRAELGRIEAPPYEPMLLRGTESDAARQFQEAMRPYARGEWEAALPGIREAARLDPAAPHVRFYLGACALMAGRTDEAIDNLRAVVALGETPFLEEALFYLARAHLLAGNDEEAQEDLWRVVKLEGDRRTEARSLLDVLERSKTGHRAPPNRPQ